MMRATRRLTAAVAAGMAMLGTGASAQPTLEYPVKATFLYKFAPFVEWPPTAFASGGQPMTICVVGDDPFHGVLDQAVRGQRAGGRAISVRRLARADRGSGCHIVYMAGSRDQSVAEGLAVLQGQPVLTVTDESLGRETGGVITFSVRDNRVRFRIDTAAAAQNGLTVSSKLLSLALNVRTGR